MDIRFIFALLVGKIALLILKLKGSGATAAPGLYALKIDPNFVSKISKSNKLQSIVISGTNGKTTTSRLTYDILGTKYKILHNRQGSNLLRGIASTLISQSTIFGRVNANLAIWEADEAALLPISEQIEIKALLLLNLFRDQLDRYGEIDTTRKKWEKVAASLPISSTLIVNSDDPSTNYVSTFTKAHKLFFGVETEKINLPLVENVADVKYCPNCSSKLTYKYLLSAHLGAYECSKCNFKRTSPQVKATNLNFGKNYSSKFDLNLKSKILNLKSTLPGLYNIYNLLAATSVSSTFDIDPGQIQQKIEKFTAVFGRFQKFDLGGKKIVIFLIKNPAGANEVIRTICTNNNLNVLAILNDNIADGRDVSWIWDTNWEVMTKKTKNLFTSGTRAADLALRLKYAGFQMEEDNINQNIGKSIKNALSKIKPGETLIVLPTYTSLLELQKQIATGAQKWQNQ